MPYMFAWVFRRFTWMFIISAAAATLMASACLADEFYTARPEDVPDWAKQGMFHFIRIDGGRIESLKAERTQWGREFTDDEKETLANIYDKYQDKIFARLKEADFNWIWVTWSNGWSAADERENQRQLRKFIKRAHADGMHVTAYLSATNMFWESTLRDEPESITWVLIESGRPVTYGGPLNPMRFIADARNPDWRKYIVKKAAGAIDAGADAVFFDNIIGNRDGLKLLFSQYQDMARRKAAKSGALKVPLYVNAHLDPERMYLNDTCEIIWNEYGKDTPGVWQDVGWDVSNARRTRFILGAKFPWQPHKYEDDKYHCGPRERCIPGQVEQKLSIAEAWAFGSSFSRNIEGRFLNALIRDEKEATDAWAAIAQYNKWISAHRALYTDSVPVARIALMSQYDGRGYAGVQEQTLADAFLKENIIFGMKVIRRLARGEPFGNYKTLVIPDVLKALGPDEEALLVAYSRSGGKIFAVTPEPGASGGGAETLKKLNYMPIAAETYKKMGEHDVPAAFLADVTKASGGALVTLANEKYVVSNLMKKKNDNVFILHLLNYEHNTPEKNVKVALDLSDFAHSLNGYTVSAFSPDGDPELRDVKIKGGTCEFTIDRIEHYAVVVVHPSKVFDPRLAEPR